MLDIAAYLKARGVPDATADRIASKLLVQVNAIEDFSNYKPSELGLTQPLRQILKSVGVVFKDA